MKIFTWHDPKVLSWKEKGYAGCHLKQVLGFSKNHEDKCIYAKYKDWKHGFHIMYEDDILLSSSDVSLLMQTKKVFVLKVLACLSEASFKELKFTKI